MTDILEFDDNEPVCAHYVPLIERDPELYAIRGEWWAELKKIRQRNREQHFTSLTPRQQTSIVAWRKYFRLVKVANKGKVRTRGKCSQYAHPDVEFFHQWIDIQKSRTEFWRYCDRAFAEFPLRRAGIELIAKMGLSGCSKYLGLLAARLERYPYWIDVTRQDYRRFHIPKRSKGSRLIHDPCPELKNLQRQLLFCISALTTPHQCSHGFVKTRSILTNAVDHVGRPVVVRADIKNAFGSTRASVVEKVLMRDLAKLELSKHALKLLMAIVTCDDSLPTGAPTSPWILNRVLFDFDENMLTCCDKNNLAYSRYADDITISGRHPTILLRQINEYLNNYGYSINRDKTRVYRQGVRQIVTGLVVNEQVSLPRHVRRNLRAAVDNWLKNGNAYFRGHALNETELRGHLAYFSMIDPAKANKLFSKLEQKK